MFEHPSVSTEYLKTYVAAKDPVTGSSADVSSDVVEMAFAGVGAKPEPADWKPATWLAPSVAGLLVGPSGLALAVGSYSWWVRVTDNPEQPVAFVDELRIT